MQKNQKSPIDYRPTPAEVEAVLDRAVKDGIITSEARAAVSVLRDEKQQPEFTKGTIEPTIKK
jgi:hypothetical protein